MQITLNGNTHIIEKDTNIAMLIKQLQLDVRKVAIECNLCIIPANEYENTYINANDAIEIVQFIGGG